MYGKYFRIYNMQIKLSSFDMGIIATTKMKKLKKTVQRSRINHKTLKMLSMYCVVKVSVF